MAELHANQIAFQAGDTAKANIAAPKDYLSRPLAELGALADRTAETVMAYEDNQLRMGLANAAVRGADMIKNEKSLDANYEHVGAKAIAEWNSVLESAPEGARRRFLAANPYAQEEYAIGVQANVLEKQQKQIYNRSKLDIAQWSSQVVNAPAEMQQAVLESKRQAIRNLGLNMEQTDSLLFDLQSEVDSYQIASYIANNKFEEARNALEHGLPTVGAAKRAMYWNSLQDAWDAEQARLVNERKAKEAAEKSGKEKQVGEILREHARLLQSGNSEGARKLREDWYYGNQIQLVSSSGETAVVYASDVDPMVRQKQYEEMKSDANNAPENYKVNGEYRFDYDRLQGSLINDEGVIDWSEAKITPEKVVLAERLYANKERFASLKDNEQGVVLKVLADQENYLEAPNINRRAIYSYKDIEAANPILEYDALLWTYTTNPSLVELSVKNQDGTVSLSRQAPRSLYFITKEYKDTLDGTPYELTPGSRADLLVNNVFQALMPDNILAQLATGITDVDRAPLLSALNTRLYQMKVEGSYDLRGTYDSSAEDFSELITSVTRRGLPDTKDIKQENGQPLLPFNAMITISMESAKGVPEESLDLPGGPKSKADKYYSKIKPEDIKEPINARTTKYIANKMLNKARREGKIIPEGFEGFGFIDTPSNLSDETRRKIYEKVGAKTVSANERRTDIKKVRGQRQVVRSTVPFVAHQLPGETPDLTKTNYDF